MVKGFSAWKSRPQRPQEIGIFLQAAGDLLLAEGVVPQGHYVRPGGVEGLHLVREDARHGGIFPIDHGKMNILEPLETAQVPLQVPEPRLPYHISYGQYPVQHSFRPLSVFIRCQYSLFQEKKQSGMAYRPS